MTAWSFACLDWQDRIRAGRSLLPALPGLDETRAAKAKLVFDRLHLPDVQGQPLMRDAAGGWFRDIVGALHGSIGQDGRRHIREPFLLVPKKNSKTSNGAAAMFTELLLNQRPYAEYLLVAPTQQVSEIAFRQVEGIIAADDDLRRRIHVQPHLKRIRYEKTNATLQIKSFSTDVLTGVKPSGVLIDELHIISSNPNAASVIGQLRGGLISQPEGFLFFITTQSDRPPQGVFKAELTKARAIRDGKIGGAVLPILYEFPEGVAWNDPGNWWMVTPNRDRSITIPRLVEEYQTATETGEAELRRWASQHLNVEIGLALYMDRWPGADFWEDQAEFGLTLKRILERSDVVTVGVDGGGLDDLLGVAVVGRDRESHRWLAWCHAYAHVCVLEKRKSEAAKLRDFAEQGDLMIVDRMEQAFEDVAGIVAEADATGALASVGLDPYGVAGIVHAMARRGISGDERVVGVSQGYKLTGTIKMAEVKLADGEMLHCGQPLMSWCVANAKVEPKGNAIVVTKQASGTGKIDPLMALFNAVALMSQNPEPPNNRSVYEDHNLLVI